MSALYYNDSWHNIIWKIYILNFRNCIFRESFRENLIRLSKKIWVKKWNFSRKPIIKIQPEWKLTSNFFFSKLFWLKTIGLHRKWGLGRIDQKYLSWYFNDVPNNGCGNVSWGGIVQNLLRIYRPTHIWKINCWMKDTPTNQMAKNEKGKNEFKQF